MAILAALEKFHSGVCAYKAKHLGIASQNGRISWIIPIIRVLIFWLSSPGQIIERS
jgi:hypothetical protein